MKYLVALLLSGFLWLSAYSQVDTTKSHFWMMTYFLTAQESAGARLAFTTDTTGTHWQKYNNEAAIIVPTTVTGASSSLMRDPMIAYDSINKRFNMVWTVSWTGTVIGWDTSSFLKNNTWGPQVGLAVGASSKAYYSWAPEIFWDDIQGKWMIYWSCSISGLNTRVMYTVIPGSDFRAFGTPGTLLNPNYDIIDADMIKAGPGNYYLFFKDERANYKYIRHTTGAKTPQGPFDVSTISSAITISPREGPTIFKQGNEFHVITDHYTANGFMVVKAKNIDTTASPWSESPVYYGTGTSAFTGSHCNVIEVPKSLVKWMLYNDSAWVKFVRNKTTIKGSFAPAMVPKLGSVGNTTKLFNLSGQMVGITGENGTLTKSIAGRLPAGLYFRSSANSKVLGPKVVVQK